MSTEFGPGGGGEAGAPPADGGGRDPGVLRPEEDPAPPGPPHGRGRQLRGHGRYASKCDVRGADGGRGLVQGHVC